MSLEPAPINTPFPVGMVTGPWMRWFRSLRDQVASTTGPAGPAGPTGPTGPAGPSGVTVETDPVFLASPAAGIDQRSIDNWNAPETDPTVPGYVKAMTEQAVALAEDMALSYPTRAVEASGWEDPAGITVTYDSAARTITLEHASYVLVYLWQGRRRYLPSPWVSPAHSAGDGAFFLYSTDGTTFAWSTTPWEFSHVMMAYARVDSVGGFTLAIREVHGAAMDYVTHEECHYNIGTWVRSGGTLTAGTYALATATDAATTPGIDSTVVRDEDIPSTLAALPQGTYQRVYIAAGVAYAASASFPFTSAGSYLQWYNAGVLTTGATGNFYNVWGVAVPVTADTASQAFRWIWIQPQAEHGTQAAALAESFSSLDLGNIFNLLTEFCPRIQIVYSTNAANGNTGKCTIATVKTLTKAKVLAI